MQSNHVTTILYQHGLRISESSGREGPAYDPYHVSKLTIERNGVAVSLIEGGLTGRKLEILLGDKDVAVREKVSLVEEPTDSVVETTFQAHTGHCLSDWMAAIKAYSKRAHSCCMRCGSHNLQDVDGYPGESLLVCGDCGRVIQSSQDFSAIV